jgi:hypothetical protein
MTCSGWSACGHPSVVDAPGLHVPLLPPLAIGGSDLGRRWCPLRLLAADLCPGQSSDRAGK